MDTHRQAIDNYGEAKARVFVLTDLGNEPDDQMSLVRLLLYANDIDIEGIVAVTSNWKKTLDEASTDGFNEPVDAYERVHPNLLKHDRAYPTADYLRSIFALGPQDYGLDAIGEGNELSGGAKALIATADKPDPRPLWVSIWGGPNALAEALLAVRKARPHNEVDAFVRKLRVYSISDQDDSAHWIRKEFPGLFYVVTSDMSPSYFSATWTGISGEHFWRTSTVGKGPDSTLVTCDWLATHIQAKGPLGAAYPTPPFIMEGDTPSWLWLIPNGLAGAWHPTWGGWGGRYLYWQPTGGMTEETHPIFTNGSCATFDDPGCTREGRSADTVLGYDGLVHTDDFATIYRWRAAYQYDFANRMDWTVKDYADTNHAPLAVVNGVPGRAPIWVDFAPGTPVTLDATGSGDPDGHALHFDWFHYKEAGTTMQTCSPEVELSAGTECNITATALGIGQAHIILTSPTTAGPSRVDRFPRGPTAG